MGTRLLQVLAQARFEILADDYIWQPLAGGTPPSPDAIACVRDGDVWHEFVPSAADSTAQRYRVVSFHFNEAVDATGFVAWLAAHRKRSAGTGVVVICGKDKRDGAMLFRASQACSITGIARWRRARDLFRSLNRSSTGDRNAYPSLGLALAVVAGHDERTARTQGRYPN